MSARAANLPSSKLTFNEFKREILSPNTTSGSRGYSSSRVAPNRYTSPTRYDTSTESTGLRGESTSSDMPLRVRDSR